MEKVVVLGGTYIGHCWKLTKRVNCSPQHWQRAHYQKINFDLQLTLCPAMLTYSYPFLIQKSLRQQFNFVQWHSKPCTKNTLGIFWQTMCLFAHCAVAAEGNTNCVIAQKLDIICWWCVVTNSVVVRVGRVNLSFLLCRWIVVRLLVAWPGHLELLSCRSTKGIPLVQSEWPNVAEQLPFGTQLAPQLAKRKRRLRRKLGTKGCSITTVHDLYRVESPDEAIDHEWLVPAIVAGEVIVQSATTSRLLHCWISMSGAREEIIGDVVVLWSAETMKVLAWWWKFHVADPKAIRLSSVAIGRAG